MPRRKPSAQPDRILALCYIRKSFTRDENDTASPERQRANIESLCARNGWIPEWYEDAEGHKSGKFEKNRPGWLALKRRLSDPRVVAVVANDLARLHRRAWHVGRTMEELDEYDVRLVFAAPGRDIDTSTPHGRMLIQFMAMQDEAYVDDISARQKDSIAHRKARGMSVGMPPFGTRRNEGGMLEPTPAGVWLLPSGVYVAGDPDDPPALGARWFGYYDCLVRLYTIYAKNRQGINRLAYRLTEEGWRFRDRKGQPRPFTRDDVRRIVANWREYAGMPTTGTAKNRNASRLDHPSAALYDTGRAVLPLPLLRAAAEVQEERSFTSHQFGVKRTVRAYALSSMVYCAHCEAEAQRQGNPGLRSRLGGVTQRGGSWYRHIEGRRCGCAARSVPLEQLEGDVARLLGLLTLNESALEALSELAEREVSPSTRQDDEAFERERAQALVRLKRKADASRHLYGEGEITRQEFERKRDEIARETAYWQNRTTDSSRIALELRQCMAALGMVAHQFSTSRPENQQALVRSLFDHLVYDLDERQIVDFRLKPWADRYMVLRAALHDAEAQGDLRTLPHSGLHTTPRHMLDRIIAAVRSYLRALYPPALRPLTSAQRNAQIRDLAARGEAQSDIASAFGLSPQRVFQIVHGRNH